jgi:hypothetical protein
LRRSGAGQAASSLAFDTIYAEGAEAIFGRASA